MLRTVNLNGVEIKLSELKLRRRIDVFASPKEIGDDNFMLVLDLEVPLAITDDPGEHRRQLNELLRKCATVLHGKRGSYDRVGDYCAHGIEPSTRLEPKAIEPMMSKIEDFVIMAALAPETAAENKETSFEVDTDTSTQHLTFQTWYSFAIEAETPWEDGGRLELEVDYPEHKKFGGMRPIDDIGGFLACLHTWMLATPRTSALTDEVKARKKGGRNVSDSQRTCAFEAGESYETVAGYGFDRSRLKLVAKDEHTLAAFEAMAVFREFRRLLVQSVPALSS